MPTDWDARLEHARSEARNSGSSGGGGSSRAASSDDPMIFIGKNPTLKRAGGYIPQGGGRVSGRMGIDAPGGVVVKPRSDRDERPLSEVLSLMYLWHGTQRFNDWQKKLDELNLIQPDEAGDFETTIGWWQKAVNLAATMQASGKGDVTPWDALEILAGDVTARAKRGEAQGPPKPSTQTQVAITNPTAARELISQALMQRLGRKPTEDEFKTFTGLLNAAEQKNPYVTRTTYGADGQSTSSSTTGGVNAGQFIDEQAMKLPDYAMWQAVGTYGQALFGALNSPVG